MYVMYGGCVWRDARRVLASLARVRACVSALAAIGATKRKRGSRMADAAKKKGEVATERAREGEKTRERERHKGRVALVFPSCC